ncbi:MAG: hypothetical protein AB7N80_08500 [Bdellovibrionales bacterium]
MKSRLVVIFNLLFFFCGRAFAVTIPKQLSKEDRVAVVKMLGLTTSTKLLTNPFPLGGYSGFEVGLSLELIDIKELNQLGAGTPDGDQELRYARLTVGKGLYNNLDLFLHAAPMTAGSEMTSFGGAVRYSFYEARFLPVNMALLMHADHININNDFESTALGADLVAGIYVNQFSLYFGVGQLRATGTFIGGNNTNGTVDPSDPQLGTSNTVSHTVTQTHNYLGLTIHFEDLFAAAQIDRYPDTTYSARVGLRF